MSDQRINVEQTVNYLNHAFMRAASKASTVIGTKAQRIEQDNGAITTTKLYDYQVDFCYLIDEMQRGPVYMVSKLIEDANALIDKLENEKRH